MPRHVLTPEERAKGQFKKGRSGNVFKTAAPVTERGRREAKRRKWTKDLAIGAEVLEAVQHKTVEKALAGDVFAQGIVWRHNLAIPRAEAQPQELPGFDSGDAVTAAEAVFKAVAQGELSIERGDLALRMIESRCRISFTVEQIA